MVCQTAYFVGSHLKTITFITRTCACRNKNRCVRAWQHAPNNNIEKGVSFPGFCVRASVPCNHLLMPSLGGVTHARTHARSHARTHGTHTRTRTHTHTHTIRGGEICRNPMGFWIPRLHVFYPGGAWAAWGGRPDCLRVGEICRIPWGFCISHFCVDCPWGGSPRDDSGSSWDDWCGSWDDRCSNYY